MNVTHSPRLPLTNFTCIFLRHIFETITFFVLQLQFLFRNHPDLREELEKFRPPVPTKQATNNIWPWVFVCAVPLVAVSLMPALGSPVLWLVQQTIGEKTTA
jgi:hypothetical protein